jgi:hypothetical protein
LSETEVQKIVTSLGDPLLRSAIRVVVGPRLHEQQILKMEASG